MQGVRQTDFPVKSVRTSVSFRGRNYTLCSQSQMEMLRLMAKQEILSKEQLGEEEINKRLDEWQETCPYITESHMTSKMSPEDLDDWKNRYRFSGVWKSKS